MLWMSYRERVQHERRQIVCANLNASCPFRVCRIVRLFPHGNLDNDEDRNNALISV